MAAAVRVRQLLTRIREMPLIVRLLTAHLLLWASYAVISHLPDTIHFDMAEAYAWGLEIQPGYYKHPPVMAWLCRLWFTVFPVTDAAFYLLSILNATLALLAVWLFAGEFVRDDRRLIAVASLMLTPLYSFLAIKFNANSVLLALWPLTAFLFVRALRTGTLGWAALFGFSAALALLAKYYSGMLLVGCVAAALVFPGRGRYFRSLSPYVTLAVFLGLLWPHLTWLKQSGGLPLRYATETRMGGSSGSIQQIADYLFGSVAYVAPALGLLIWIGSGRAGRVGDKAPRAPGDRDQYVLAVLVGCCLLLPAVVGLIFGIRVGATWSLPAWFAAPVLVLTIPRLHFDSAAQRQVVQAALALSAGAFVVSPLVAFVQSRTGNPSVVEARREAAEGAASFWREHTGARLKLVAGSDALAEYVSFYALEHPSLFIRFDLQKAPWVTPRRLAREGLLIVCRDSDEWCQREAQQRAGPPVATLSFQRQVFGRAMAPYKSAVWIVPPQQ